MHLRTPCVTLAAAALLAGCGRGDFVVETWVSDEFVSCRAPAACDGIAPAVVDSLALVPNAADSLLLATLADSSRIDEERLAAVTRVPWREHRQRGPVRRIRLGGVNPLGEHRAAWVVEIVRTDAARDTVMSIASNGGAAVWLNGAPLGASRAPSRPARARQDLYSVAFRPGRNVLLYKVTTGSVDAQLHREWHDQATLAQALSSSIELGAYADLPRDALLRDTATMLALDPPQVRLAGRPVIAFRWLSLLGEPLADGGRHEGAYPDALPIPAAFAGMAVLEVSVTDGGRLVFHEEVPVFRDSTAARLARALIADSVSADPVRSARIDAVRTVLGLGADTASRYTSWHRAHALANLYRHVAQPDAFHRHPGPQIWGWRDAAGAVQPYWLTVPPAALEASADAPLPGLVFSLVHFVDSSYWRGRGSSAGWVTHMSTLSTMNHNFSVVPHLRGSHDFDSFGVAELAGIVHQVDSVFPLDTGAVAILAWSAHAVETVELAAHAELPLAVAGFAVPALHPDPDTLARALVPVRAVRPDMRFVLWRAGEDDRIPQERTEGWVETLRRAGFDVDYVDVPFSTHLGGFFEDVEAELHRRVSPAARR